MKDIRYLLLTGLTLVTLAACGTTTAPDTETSMPETSSMAGETRVFTLEELSEFDGKDGNPAYVAIDGVVYDVTDVDAWTNGEHQNGITAGHELSEEILDSPHGMGVLEDLPVVGTLADE